MTLIYLQLKGKVRLVEGAVNLKKWFAVAETIAIAFFFELKSLKEEIERLQSHKK